MAHAAITGASGLLGANLAAELIAQGHTVTAIRRASTDPSALADLPITWVSAGLNSTGGLCTAFAGADVVFHCAANVATSGRISPAMAATNVDGTRAVIEAAIACGTPRLVHTSTVNTIGPDPRGAPADERTAWAMDRFKLSSAYAITKWRGEILVDLARDRLDAVVVNPTYLVGARDARPSSGRLIVDVVNGRLPLWTPGFNNFADVREVARGMVAAWLHGKRGERYILGGQELTYRDFMERVARAAGVKPPARRLPHSAAWVGGKLGDLGELITRRESTVNSFTVRYAFTDVYRYRSDKAVSELGYVLAPIEPAIRSALDWFAERGMIRPT